MRSSFATKIVYSTLLEYYSPEDIAQMSEREKKILQKIVQKLFEVLGLRLVAANFTVGLDAEAGEINRLAKGAIHRMIVENSHLQISPACANVPTFDNFRHNLLVQAFVVTKSTELLESLNENLQS